MTLIPQKVFPKGPTGELENVVRLPSWRNKDLLGKFCLTVSDLVLVPAAFVALMV